jgi:aspartyl-tRNA(Asn)/glutamyl-tRNA(Gln) amidotransferase subunit A
MKYGYRDPRPWLHTIYASHARLWLWRRGQAAHHAGHSRFSAGYYEAFYKKAQQVRTLIASDYKAAFQKVDVIVGPTSPTVAFPIGEKVDDPLAMYLNDVYTVPANLAGITGISVPCGFSGGLPVGLQLLGNHFREADVLRVAHAYQLATDWHMSRPALRVENSPGG